MALDRTTALHLKKVLENEQANRVTFVLPENVFIDVTKIVQVDEATHQVVCDGEMTIPCGNAFTVRSGTHYVPLEQIRAASHNGK